MILARTLLLVIGLLFAFLVKAQPCLVGYNFTQSPPPTNGTYGCGETVTFCFTVTFWNSTNANWFHGITANFGPGWDLSTLSPGAPPASCSGTGSWSWYPSVQGTAGTNIGPQGPGFFYNYTTPADGNPGNNFGDFCTGAVNWQFCWTISVLSPPACVSGLNLGVSFNTYGDSETGGWGSAGCGSDPIVPSTPAVIQACALNAGTSGNIAVCSNSAPVILNTGLGGNPDAGGAWTTPGGSASTGIFNPATDAGGIYTYTVSAVAPPCTQSATVNVTVVQQQSAGTSTSTTVCAGDPPFSCIGLLGAASPGGTWSGPAGAFSGTFSPAVDPPGTYTYTVNPGPPCASSSATLTVIVNPTPNAGGNGSITLCANAAPVNLFSSLAGSPSAGGSWNGPSGPMNGTFDPAVNTAGNYTYTVTGAAPCPSSSATVAVAVNPLPFAGTNASATLCSTSPAVSMTGLLGGSPDLNGTWTDPYGIVVPNTISPATASSGAYTYTVVGSSPCPNATATLNLSVNTQPSAGSSAVLNLCTASASIDLFSSLGGAPDLGGMWNGPAGQISNTTFTPGVSPAGNYTYTIAATPPCWNASATVTVNVSTQPSAGVSAPLSVCSNGVPVALLASLGATAQPGGSWSSPTGSVATGAFTPGTSADGAYTYTIMGVAPCPDASATVTVTTTPASNAGTGNPLALCSSGASVSLFSSIAGNPQAGGTWTTPSGAAMNGTLNPASATSGAYTYTIPANGPCPAATTTVNVNVAQAVNAGNNGSQALCSTSGASYNMFSALDGSPSTGGAWTDPSGSAHAPTFTAGTDTPGIYTYTVNGAAPCPSASSTVNMQVVQAPFAGTGGAVAICANAAVINPMQWLSGAPQTGGTWSAPNGSAISQIDPATAPSGSYTYTVAGSPPCPSATATVQLTIDQLPNAGTDGALNICINGPTTGMLALLSGAQVGGQWAGPSGASNGNFAPGSNPPGTYTYTVNGSGACASISDQSQVSITVNPLPQPSFITDVNRGCAPLTVEFTNTTVGQLLTAGWNFGDGGMTSSVTGAWHTYLAPGRRSVTLTVVDVNGCEGSITMNDAVIISGGPSASFNAMPLRMSIESPTTTINHEIEAGAHYLWSIDGFEVDTIGPFAWTFTDEDPGYHDICLLATDTLGCSNTFCLRVLVDDNLTIWVPNAFTPNDDDKNEVFRPSILGVAKDWYELMIFDRWGLLVFRTDDPALGWNGSLNNGGELLPQDVYVWKLKAKDQFTPEKAEHIGTVTLLR